MFEDGVRALNVEERFQVRDLAEIVVETLNGTETADGDQTR